MAKDTRARLLTAAARLFGAKGYDPTTVGMIEKAAGLSPRAGGFYRHFKSKEDILIALATEGVETPERLGLDRIAQIRDTRAELTYIARAYAELNDGTGLIAGVIRSEAGRIAALRRLLETENARILAALVAWLADKPIGRDLAEDEAAELVLMIFGGWLFYLDRRDRLGAVAAIDDDRLIERWAAHWAPIVDAPPGAIGMIAG
ncbi:MAG: helix-turn-helix domain-containing protein [Pseudomonadota bacterium]